MILVINAKDLDQRFPNVRKAPGVKVSAEPHRVEYPSPDGGTIPVMVSMLWDADGYFVELNQILGRPAGSSK